MERSSIFELSLEAGPGPFRVLGFTGRERISKCFRFDLTFDGPAIDADAIERLHVGRPARFRLAAGGHERWVHGVLHRLAAAGLGYDGEGRHAFRARLVPALRLLGHRKDSRIFQDMTVPQIVEAVLKSARVPWTSRLGRSYGKRSYVVQHQETDLAFVERLLAEEGIFYFFDHPSSEEGRETLVLADEASACAPIAGDRTLRVREWEGMNAVDDRDVRRFELGRKVGAGKVRLADFDFLRPSFDLAGDASVDDALEQYHHHAELEPAQVDDGAAEVRLAQHRRKLWIARGQTRSCRLVPGTTFTIEEAKVDKHPGSYTTFSLEHEGRDLTTTRTSGASSAAPSGATHVYENRFEAVPSSVAFRPRPPRPRTQQVLETATVVGPPGEEIHTDEHGRIKVKFHWDRLAKRDDHASCWIRVMQPWGGAGWGFQFIPRVGMEVMVAFLAGDTDRPVILGSVYNAEHPPTFALPSQKTKSGIRTKSTPRGDGYNEISFEDQRGEENIVVRAERHLTENVNVDRNTDVGNDDSLRVGKNLRFEVGGNMVAGVKGNRREVVEGDGFESTRGKSSLNVGGNRSESVHGNRSLSIAGSSHGDVTGSAALKVGAHASVAAQGSLSVHVGSKDGAPGTIHGHGPLFVASDKDLVLNATGSVTIACGSSVIKLSPEQIEIRGKTLLLKADEKTTAKGGASMLELASEAKLAGPAARMFGSAASVEASANAYMKGAQVQLGVREGDPPKASDASAPIETRPLKLKLSNGGFAAFASRPYEMTVDGVRYSGTTDGGGNVVQDIPASATTARILLWEGDPPAGKQHQWNLVIAEPQSPSSPSGARGRLANLGYEVGQGDELDPATQKAIADFQKDHDLEETGALDGATVEKLTEVHGH